MNNLPHTPNTNVNDVNHVYGPQRRIESAHTHRHNPGAGNNEPTSRQEHFDTTPPSTEILQYFNANTMLDNIERIMFSSDQAAPTKNPATSLHSYLTQFPSPLTRLDDGLGQPQERYVDIFSRVILKLCELADPSKTDGGGTNALECIVLLTDNQNIAAAIGTIEDTITKVLRQLCTLLTTPRAQQTDQKTALNIERNITRAIANLATHKSICDTIASMEDGFAQKLLGLFVNLIQEHNKITRSATGKRRSQTITTYATPALSKLIANEKICSQIALMASSDLQGCFVTLTAQLKMYSELLATNVRVQNPTQNNALRSNIDHILIAIAQLTNNEGICKQITSRDFNNDCVLDLSKVLEKHKNNPANATSREIALNASLAIDNLNKQTPLHPQ